MSRRHVVAAACAVLMLSPVAANRFRDNPDHLIDRKVEGWTVPIGQIDADEPSTPTAKAVGTAFVMSPCYALTNFHVVFYQNPQPDHDYGKQLHVGVSSTGPFLGHTLATPVRWGDHESNGKHDWALLKLNACVGLRPEIGWLDALDIPSSELVGKTIIIAGFAADRLKGQMSVGEGKVLGVDRVDGMLVTNASAAPGQSGSPVLISEGGILKVVGIFAGTNRDDDQPGRIDYDHYTTYHANHFVNLHEVLAEPDIHQIIDEDRAGHENPNLARERLKR